MSSVVLAPSVPLYLQGVAPMRRRSRFAQTATAPKVPLYMLGSLGADSAKIIGASAPIAATATTAILASTAWASAAGPIGAAVGLVVGVIAGIWAKHEARVKGAKDENTAVNSAVTAFDGAMHAIFDAANSTDPKKNIPASTAAQLVQQQFQTFWQSMAPHMTGPGRADTSGFGTRCGDGTINPAGACKGTPGGHKCDKACTAACCVGCQDLYPTMLQAMAVFNSPTGGTVTACNVSGSKYGAVTRGAYTLTYTPPAVEGSASSLVAALTGGGGGASLPMLAVAALVAWAVLR